MEDHLDEGRRGDEGPHLAWQACAPVHECVCVSWEYCYFLNVQNITSDYLLGHKQL